jgi:hypothetical protein
MATETSQQAGALSSWKDIAKYTGKGVRTVQLRIPAEADQHSWMKPITIPV